MRRTASLVFSVLGPVLGLALTTQGCARQSASTLTRRVDGETVTGRAYTPSAYQHFLEGELELARGDLPNARVAFERAIAAGAGEPLVRARLAEVRARLGEHEAAEAILNEAERLAPDDLALWMARGRIAEETGDLNAATAAYQRAARVAPSSPEPSLAAAEALRRSGRAPQAVSLLAEHLAREPRRSGTAWWRLLELLVETDASATSIEEAAEAAHTLAPRLAPAIRALAETVAELGRAEVVAALLEPLPRIEADVTAYLMALAGTGRLEDAVRLLDHYPDSLVSGPLGRARLHLALGRPAMAVSLAQTIAESTHAPRAYLVLGRAHRAQTQTALAIAALERVPSGADDYVPARLELAGALAEAGQAQRARRVLEQLSSTHGEAEPEIDQALEALGAGSEVEGPRSRTGRGSPRP